MGEVMQNASISKVKYGITVSLNAKSESLPPIVHYVFAVIFCLVVIIGTLSNGMAVYVFIRRDLLKTATNIHVMCLCICDLVMASMATPLITISSLHKVWQFPKSACTYYGFIVCFMSYIQIHLVTCIAVERYVTVVKLHLKAFLTVSIAWKIVIISCVHSFLWAFAPIAGWSSYELEGMNTSCSIDWANKSINELSFSLALLVVLWCAPLLIIIYSYSKIIQKISKQNSSLRYALGRERQNSSLQNNLTVTTMILIAAFVLTWTPYAIVSAWAAIGNPEDIHPIVATVPALAVKISVTFNPLIYLYRNGKYRKQFFMQFPCLSKLFSTKVMPLIFMDNRTVPNTSIRNRSISFRGQFLQPRSPTIGHRCDNIFVVWNSARPNSVQLEVQSISDQSFD